MTHLKEKCEDEFAEPDGNLGVANLIRCTICRGKSAEFFVVLARARGRLRPSGLARR